MLTIICKTCGHKNEFEQRYLFHAGFADQGFLYNDEGNLTLTWSAFDPAYVAIVGETNPWALSSSQQHSLEAVLRDAPSGGRWRFANPARCVQCSSPISGPITQTIYYIRYAGSLIIDNDPGEYRFKELLLPGAFGSAALR